MDRISLHTQVLTLIALAVLAGGVFGWVWFDARQSWQSHLDRVFVAGVNLHAVLTGQSMTVPQAFTVTAVTPDHQGGTARFDDLPQPALETQLSLLTDPGVAQRGGGLTLRIYSPRLTYPLSQIAPTDSASAAVRFGQVLRMLATYCSDAVLFAQDDTGQWLRVDGAGLWGCAAAPRDLRLPAAIALVLVLAGLVAWAGAVTSGFRRLSEVLRDRARVGGVAPLPADTASEGPLELRQTTRSINRFLAAERARLEQRAELLAGVSHDLGTPATRLKLRALLIEDPALRGKLERDIDQMLDMIDGVLSYTREEMAAEPMQKVSVAALMQSIADDYADTGHPVCLQQTALRAPVPSGSIFARRGRGGRRSHETAAAAPDEARMLAMCRPDAVRRAVCNLIDNALKYGRRATVSVEATAQSVLIHVADQGSAMDAATLQRLTQPFSRGANAGRVRGVGLGLSLVQAVARQHGGSLDFADTGRGLRVTLRLRRQ